MRISDILGLRIALLGFGVEGRSVVDALRRRGHREPIHAIGQEPVAAQEGLVFQHTDAAVARFPEVDVVVRSPGFAPHHPLRQRVDAAGLAQTTTTRLFLRELRALGQPLIGLTGSKGKSTTSTLTQLTLTAAGVPVVLVGNVGVPALDLLERIAAEKLAVVMELSSYQCADLENDFGPEIAGLLDLFPEHLDWHGDLDAYYAAKLRIIASQRPSDRARYNPLPRTLAPLPERAVAMNTADSLHYDAGYFWRGSERLFSAENMRLPGLHNRRNAMAALTLAELLGARTSDLQSVLQDFNGLPFRLQDEGVFGGIHWYNDAISTAPEAIAAALEALTTSALVRTLIAGGQRRGLTQTLLVDALATSTVRHVIVLPDTGEDIAREVRARKLELTVHEVDTLEQAVALATRVTPRGGTCLFSPGAPSYNQYKSFVARGEAFQKLIRNT